MTLPLRASFRRRGSQPPLAAAFKTTIEAAVNARCAFCIHTVHSYPALRHDNAYWRSLEALTKPGIWPRFPRVLQYFAKTDAGRLELAPTDFSLGSVAGRHLRALALRAHKIAILAAEVEIGMMFPALEYSVIPQRTIRAF